MMRPPTTPACTTPSPTCPPAEQQAVRLLKLEELTLNEAAARTGLSTTALKVACHRALRRLRTLLDPT